MTRKKVSSKIRLSLLRAKWLLVILVLFALLTLYLSASKYNERTPIRLWKIPQTDEINESQDIQPDTEDNFPPVFPGIEWWEPYTTEVKAKRIVMEVDVKPEDENTEKLYRGIVYGTDPLDKEPLDMLNYYDEKLTSEGWRWANAESPGGLTNKFQKEDKLVEISVHVDPDDRTKYEVRVTYWQGE